MNRAKAAAGDGDHALRLNPDSAAALKYRGRAHMLLGSWTAAAADLNQANSIDFDDEVASWLDTVRPNAKRALDHKRKYDRLREERELKLRVRSLVLV